MDSWEWTGEVESCLSQDPTPGGARSHPMAWPADLSETPLRLRQSWQEGPVSGRGSHAWFPLSKADPATATTTRAWEGHGSQSDPSGRRAQILQSDNILRLAKGLVGGAGGLKWMGVGGGGRGD